MGMCNEERQVREILRTQGATLKRVRGHHEIWELPNGHSHTLVTGRVERRLWKNTLSQLRYNLARPGRLLRVLAVQEDGSGSSISST